MLEVLRRTIHRLKHDILDRGYQPILEADINGWLFHFLAGDESVEIHELHSDTRVCGASGFFDLAIGPFGEAADGRPCITPRLVVEIKFFPESGFTPQQHRVHYEHILDDDLRKLGELAADVECAASLAVDGKGYLAGTYHRENRRDVLVRKRNEVAPKAHLFVISKVGGSWEVEHIAPNSDDLPQI